MIIGIIALLTGITLGLFGLAGLGLTISTAIKEPRARAGWIGTTGIVVDYEHREFMLYSVHHSGWSPVIEFTTASGEALKFELGICRREDKPIGQSLKVRYNPVDPRIAEIDSWRSTWWVLISMFFCTLLFLGMALGFLFFAIPLLW